MNYIGNNKRIISAKNVWKNRLKHIFKFVTKFFVRKTLFHLFIKKYFFFLDSTDPEFLNYYFYYSDRPTRNFSIACP